jgi:hypothetical protein
MKSRGIFVGSNHDHEIYISFHYGFYNLYRDLNKEVGQLTANDIFQSQELKHKKASKK